MIEYGACRVYLMVVVLVKWERAVLFTNKTHVACLTRALYRTLVSHWDERGEVSLTLDLVVTTNLLWTYTSVRTSVRVVAHLPARVACDR